MKPYENLSLDDMPNEIWRDVVGYEGSYQVSNMGRVKMVNHYVNAPQGKRMIKSHILKQIFTKQGYLYVELWDSNNRHRYAIHRLVLMAFVPNINSLPEVNHKDENKENNYLSNLEWCDRDYNINYGCRKEKHRQKMINHPNMSKIVYQYDLNGKFIKEYPSVRETSRQTKLYSSNISRCCLGKDSQCGGFIFKYKD